MKKRFNFFVLLLIVGAVFLTSCSKKLENKEKKDNKKIVYTTFFPVTYLTKTIVKDKMTVKTLIKGSDEPHSFELKATDMKDILSADLFVFNGANMESFVDALKTQVKDDDKFLNLSDGLTLLDSSDDLNKNHEKINPHTWLSVKNAMIQLDTIYKKVSSIDPKNEVFYKENLNKALSEFKALDEKFKTKIEKINKKDKYFVVSHAAFNYLANDYGLKQIAVTGISPEEEPSAKQLKIIADFVKKNNITTIFFEGKATPKVAKTLSENTNTKTSTLYTMENLTEDEANLGYLKLMEKNLDALIESFN